ncbi:hypothetical protein CAOG_08598 [Capsaspora owczarzaki ATCC 30864]|nr:hypothetical protein CAOG_08598 [Capsaspora owczarzaki ATCC 30864]|eukprot:XP_011270198.1 hypothetical protein CAOG_08598 [Capsaspora owczarzaki ATCC 30864]
MRITSENVGSLQLAKRFRDNSGRVNSLCLAPSGELCVTSSDDDSIHIYDCVQGKVKSKLYSKKYGCDLIHFAHGAKSVLHASNKVDNTIRYLSLHDNKYLRYFIGHTQRVVSLATSPSEDLFMTGSYDGTARLWDLRSNNTQGLLHTSGAPIVSFDPEGVLFAAGIESSMIKLYDLRTFDRGPFSTFNIQHHGEWIDIQFSNDGKLLLVSTRPGSLLLVDAYTGDLKSVLANTGNGAALLKGCFSPDGQFVFCGGIDGCVSIWSSSTGRLLTRLQGHTGPVECVVFNPKLFSLASASSEVGLWLPDDSDK